LFPFFLKRESLLEREREYPMFILVGGGRFHASLLPVLWSSKPLGAREFFCLSLTCSSEGCVPPESYPVEVLSPNLMGCRVLCLFSFFLCVLWQEGFHTTFGFRVWPFPAWCCRCFSGWALKVCLFHRLDLCYFTGFLSTRVSQLALPLVSVRSMVGTCWGFLPSFGACEPRLAFQAFGGGGWWITTVVGLLGSQGMAHVMHTLLPVVVAHLLTLAVIVWCFLVVVFVCIF
jgi:hypothetical protein